MFYCKDRSTSLYILKAISFEKSAILALGGKSFFDYANFLTFFLKTLIAVWCLTKTYSAGLGYFDLPSLFFRLRRPSVILRIRIRIKRGISVLKLLKLD